MMGFKTPVLGKHPKRGGDPNDKIMGVLRNRKVNDTQKPHTFEVDNLFVRAKKGERRPELGAFDRSSDPILPETEGQSAGKPVRQKSYGEVIAFQKKQQNGGWGE